MFLIIIMMVTKMVKILANYFLQSLQSRHIPMGGQYRIIFRCNWIYLETIQINSARTTRTDFATSFSQNGKLCKPASQSVLHAYYVRSFEVTNSIKKAIQARPLTLKYFYCNRRIPVWDVLYLVQSMWCTGGKQTLLDKKM